MSPSTDPLSVRSIFPTATHQRDRLRNERELALWAESLCAQVRSALAELSPINTEAAQLGGATTSWQSVTLLAEECLKVLTSTGTTGPSTTQLWGLALDLYELGVAICQRDKSYLERRMADCSNALRRLRVVPTSVGLQRQACQELVAACGFSRAVISRIDAAYWQPLASYQSDNSAPRPHHFLDRRIPIAESTPEFESRAGRRTVVVRDPAVTIDRTHPTSYVVAPVVRDADIIGFLHADHWPFDQPADDVDGEILAAFADGFGLLLERTNLLERLQQDRNEVQKILADAVASTTPAAGELMTGRSWWTDLNAAPAGRPLAAAPISELSVRELEVYGLMAAGATNGTIAAQLVISEDTVKSHVKHILRKLGLANRSQVVAASLRARHKATPGGQAS
ncbi:LuxR C-terminal-related transcriptional regulator [Mycobacterium sp. E1747]|uniref:LuxR C-terminal-related transcriptional regulator n=1 Tax=Mycobacterium sp. E1747 TaxID=1834128 RepID=UPI0009EF5B86|nr:LuxR C-terminal-related transcriptional regulator [Mycobacterium sp. E1747]